MVLIQMAKSRTKTQLNEYPDSALFLMIQIVFHASRIFGKKTATLGLSTPQSGILRLIGSAPKQNQKDLARRLGILPSRLVLLLDELEEKGLLVRERDRNDRRNSYLNLTRKGEVAFRRLAELTSEHEAEICAALDDKELAALGRLCGKIAAQQGLTAGVHPGYKTL